MGMKRIIEKRQQDKPVKNNILPKCRGLNFSVLLYWQGDWKHYMANSGYITILQCEKGGGGLGFSRCLEHISAIPQQNKFWRPNSSLARPIKINADNFALVHHKSQVLPQCTLYLTKSKKSSKDTLTIYFSDSLWPKTSTGIRLQENRIFEVSWAKIQFKPKKSDYKEWSTK